MAQRGAMRRSRQHAATDERGGHVPRAAFLIACERWNPRPFDLPGNDCFPQDREAAAQQAFRAYFFLDMNLDAGQQRCRVQQSAHETDLVDRSVEEEPAERNKAPFGEVASAIVIALPRPVGLGQQRLITRLATRKPAGHRPKAGSDAEPFKERMRHQTRDASIAVEEGMDPQEAVVDRPNCLYFPQVAERWLLVGVIEPRHEPRQVAMFGRHMEADLDIVLAPLARNDWQLLTGSGVGHQ